jgi:hypothetical protein
MNTEPTGSSITVVEAADRQIGFYIPLTSEDFGSFISGLLQSPRELVFSKRCRFFITYQDIIDLHELIAARLGEQHRTSLASFTSQIWYDDDTSLIYKSYDDFKVHGEIGNKRCIAVSVSWVFLVDLPGSDAPQKQTIEVLHSVDPPYIFEMEEDWSIARLRFRSHHSEGIRLSITHTHVSLGYDLANLLKGRLLRNVIEWKPSIVNKAFRGIVSFGLSLSLLTLVIIGTRWLFKPDYKAIETASLEELSKAIQGGGLAGTLVMLSGIVLIPAAFALYSALTKAGPSFIALSEQQKKSSEAKLSAEDKSFNRNLLSATAGLAAAVTVNVVSSGLWEYILKW